MLRKMIPVLFFLFVGCVPVIEEYPPYSGPPPPRIVESMIMAEVVDWYGNVFWCQPNSDLVLMIDEFNYIEREPCFGRFFGFEFTSYPGIYTFELVGTYPPVDAYITVEVDWNGEVFFVEVPLDL